MHPLSPSRSLTANHLLAAAQPKLHTETYTIPKLWSWLAAVSVEITCDPSMPTSIKLGLAVRAAYSTGADLRGADLRDADLRGADLRDADLRGADLRDADLRDADLTGADLRGADLRDADLTGADLRGAVLTGVPKIENIHQSVYAAASAAGALDMSDWHKCETAHCRAGWVTRLAGQEGARLEARVGTAGAATLIYLASDPALERVPDFYCGNGAAMADMKRLADAEAARLAGAS